MITIRIASTTDPPNKVDRSYSLIQAFSGTLKNETEMFTPSVLIVSSRDVAYMLENANYAVISFSPTCTRHYFITGFESLNNGVYRINCKEDVLKYFAAEIKALKCTVARQENVRNGYLVDPEYNALCYKAYVTKAFPNAITNDSLYLITTG